MRVEQHEAVGQHAGDHARVAEHRTAWLDPRELRVDVVVAQNENCVTVDPLVSRVPGCSQAMMTWVWTTEHCRHVHIPRRSPYHEILAVPAW